MRSHSVIVVAHAAAVSWLECVLIATDAVLSREQLCLWHCCSLSCVRFQRAYIQYG